MEVAAVLLLGDHAAAGGQDDARHAGQFVDHVALAASKPLLAFHIEDPGDVGTGFLFDHAVGIVKRAAQNLSEVSAQGAFTRTHGPD